MFQSLFDGFRQWLMGVGLVVARRSQLGKAVAYAQSRLRHAIRFVDHPLLTLDRNKVENMNRDTFVIGRKKRLFSSSPPRCPRQCGPVQPDRNDECQRARSDGYLSHLLDHLQQ